MKLTNLKYYIEFLFWSISFVALFVLSVITISEATGSIYDYFGRHEVLTLLLTSIIFITPVNIFFYWLLSKGLPSIITKVQNIFLRLLFILSIATIIFLAFGFLLNILQANLLMTDLKISFFSSIPVFILIAVTFFGIKNQVSFKLYSFAITLLALSVTVFGFSQIDSPVKYHAIETDFENYNSLTNVHYDQYPFSEVLEEYNRNQQLPEVLSEDNRPKYNINIPIYSKLNNSDFSLCLNFEHDSPISWINSAYNVGELYSTGEQCFTYQIVCDHNRMNRYSSLRDRSEEMECSEFKINFIELL